MQWLLKGKVEMPWVKARVMCTHCTCLLASVQGKDGQIFVVWYVPRLGWDVAVNWFFTFPERPIADNERMLDILQRFGMQRGEVRFFLRHERSPCREAGMC